MKNGWKMAPMGTLCSIKNGKSNAEDAEEDGEYAFFDRSKKTKRSTRYLYDCEALIIPGEGAEFLPRHFIGKFDLHQRAYALFDFSKNIDVRFLFHYLTHFKDYFVKVAVGATVKSLRLRHFEQLPVPVPSRPEQQRIGGILDETFDGIAIAQANAEKNRKNARDLFESYLQSVFTQRGKGWLDSTVGAEIRFIDYRGKTPVKTPSGIRLITAKNVKIGYLQETPMEFIASASYKGWMTRGIPQKGDVLFTTEAPLANVAQLDTDQKVAFAQRIIIMQPNAAKLDSTFLKYLLLSRPVQQRIRTKGTGATVQGIKASLLKNVDISFPKSLTDQQHIVEKLDRLNDHTQHLSGLYERKLSALETLKKSLLHQAFSGQL